MKKTIEIIGGGCAGFSLAKRAKELKEFNIKLYTYLNENKNVDHYWGFWNTKKTDDALKKSGLSLVNFNNLIFRSALNLMY